MKKFKFNEHLITIAVIILWFLLMTLFATTATAQTVGKTHT